MNLATGVFWQSAAIATKMFGGFFLLPAVLRLLSKEEIACWYLFNTCLSLSVLLEFGFGSAVTRFFAYSSADASAQTSTICGLPEIPADHSLMRTFSLVYLFITLLVLSIGGGAGWWYFGSLTWKVPGPLATEQLWLFVAFTAAINILAAALNNILVGKQLLKKAAQLQIFAQGFSLLLALLAVLAGRKLVFLTAAVAIGALLNFCVHAYANKKLIHAALKQSNHRTQTSVIIKTVWPSAWRMGVVSVGAFLITQSSTLLMGKYLEPSIIAGYGLVLQLFSALSGFAGVFARSAVPSISKAHAQNDLSRIKFLISITTGVSLLTYATGTITIVLAGPMLIALLKSQAILPTQWFIALMGSYLFLEFNHSMFATYITTTNQIPFLPASLISGTAIIVSSWLLLEKTDLGIAGPMMAQSLVQLAFNNWYWPRYVLRQTNLTVPDISLTFVNYLLLFSRRLSKKTI